MLCTYQIFFIGTNSKLTTYYRNSNKRIIILRQNNKDQNIKENFTRNIFLKIIYKDPNKKNNHYKDEKHI